MTQAQQGTLFGILIGTVVVIAIGGLIATKMRIDKIVSLNNLKTK